MEMFNHHLINNSEMLYSPEEESFREEALVGSSNNSNQHSFCSFPKQPVNRSSSASDVMLPNVFVQIPIHTTTVHHSHRQQNREIKSEPIKSENDNRSLTPTSTPSSSSSTIKTISQISLPTSVTNLCSQPQSTQSSINVINSTLVTARPKPSIKCFKCTVCPFISISQAGLDLHTTNCHQDNTFAYNSFASSVKRKVSCPGCENVFYSKKSLKIHLVNDHQMSHSEMMMLLSQNAAENENPNANDIDANEFFASTPITTEPISNKQKIYLKDVEILKNPTFQSVDLAAIEEFPSFGQFNDANPIEDYTANLVELIDDELPPFSDDQVNENRLNVGAVQPPLSTEFQNKIFVKNDNILKNPEIVNNQFNFVNNSFEFGVNQPFSSDESQILNIIETPPPPTTPQIIFSNDGIVSNASTAPQQLSDMPRKPCKIFIKNVDILKKPMFLNTHSGSNSNSLSPQPHQFFNNLNSFGNAANKQQQLQQQQQQTIVPCSFSGIGNFDASFTFRASPPRYIDNISPVTNHQKKIFIKNIDILKKPAEEMLPLPSSLSLNPPENSRKTLHLRTVDELNLMNINEVQNLVENYQEEEPTEAETAITNENETEEYNEIPDYLCNGNFDHPNDQCLESAIQDFVRDFRADKTDTFQYPMQGVPENSQNSFGKDSQHIVDFESNLMHFSNTNELIVLDNIIDSTTSSMDEKTNKSDQMSRTNSTPDTAPLYYSNFPEHFQETSDNNEKQTQSIIDYERAFNEEILFVDEIVNNGPMVETADESVVENEEILPLSNRLQENLMSNSEVIQIEDGSDGQEKHEIQKGRIYVISNLLKVPESSEPLSLPLQIQLDEQNIESIETTTVDSSPATVQSITNPESLENTENLDFVRDSVDASKSKKKIKKNIGRPRGMRKIDSTIRNNSDTQSGTEIFYKCSLDCAMRFRTPEILNFHERCHDPMHKNKIICPECQQTGFKVWNTLHTHLWRQHQIDMELYSCELCSFRTPILSRLLNTHMKIHSDERNFKCSQCEKAFKNTKQLKNHRRIHSQVVIIRKCEICDILFYNQNHLSDHIRSFHQKQDEYKCKICDSRFSSIKARETHLLNHKRATKYRCAYCSYTSNDINAYRRHKMTHTEDAGYICKYCDFKSIQSSTYMKHVVRSHPEEADKIIFSCTKCKFITINKRKFELHVLNHDFIKQTNTTETENAAFEQEDDEEHGEIFTLPMANCELEIEIPYTVTS